jgi:hypothetical protein
MMKEMGTISDSDMELFLVTDSIEEAVELIKENSIKRYGLKPEGKYPGHLDGYLNQGSDSNCFVY